MAGVTLRDYQEDALNRMKNGCILNGGTGSGKSRTALAYYYCQNGGELSACAYIRMTNPCDLYIITTANKRDALEWEGELANFHMSIHPEVNLYKNKVIVDSWNNIHKYVGIRNSMFIFDEQHVSGYGSWTHAFLTIAKRNKWILLSATPGDTWMDYIPVFIANGFYRNKTDFCFQHVIYSRFTNYPKVERYIDEGKLIKLRKDILVSMDFERKTIPHHESIFVSYDREKYDYVMKNRWNIYKDAPIENAGEFCLVLRRIVNSDPSRQTAILDIFEKHNKAIIFYSYDYELDILRKLFEGICTVAERNGHKHDELPKGDKWVYLVQYSSGSEAWNCITTDTIIFFSQSYSYRTMVQATGRIDRVNTPYIDLYYYHLKTTSKIDNAIHMALKRKQKFNEKKFAPDFDKKNIDISKYCEEHSSWKNPLE
jgi:hypothetical protein